MYIYMCVYMYTYIYMYIVTISDHRLLWRHLLWPRDAHSQVHDTKLPDDAKVFHELVSDSNSNCI